MYIPKEMQFAVNTLSSCYSPFSPAAFPTHPYYIIPVPHYCTLGPLYVFLSYFFPEMLLMFLISNILVPICLWTKISLRNNRLLMLVRRGDSNPYNILLCVTVCCWNHVYELGTKSFFFSFLSALNKNITAKSKTHHYYIFIFPCSDSRIINFHASVRAQCVLYHVIGKCK